ncbi:MAG: Na(+)-translocating NADH-quinone reductase subunit F [Planctomycetes bacterium]|nr:Na(+)-translocating NADH-quinone reductase subunit F [Planctomycetota bacterium]
MTDLRALPDDVTVDVPPEATFLDALVAAGVPIARACGGKARCSTCRVRVESGTDLCAPRNAAESAMAARLSLDDATRLACQTTARGGGVTVRRLVLDELDVRLASAAAGAGGAVGREEEMAILFSDIAGFTSISEALPAYDVVHVLERWFAAAGDVAAAHGGRIDNYMGDGFMAVFPDAPQAVRAALALADAAAQISRYTTAAYGRSFTARTGIHFGSAVVGTLGAAHNRRETVIGDAVNVASRIESANKDADTRLLVSADADARLPASFLRGRTATVALKGKTAPCRVVEIVGERAG